MDDWHLKVKICLLRSQKFAFGEFEKAIFEVVTRHWEHIFFLLTTPKCDMGEVGKAKFEGSYVTLTSFSAS